MSDQFRAAYEATHQCLVLANSIRLCVEEATHAMPDGFLNVVDEMANSFPSTMLELLAAVNKAEGLISPVHEKLMGSEPVHVGKVSYGSFHEASVNVANRVFEEAWKVTDRDGFRASQIDMPKLRSGFLDAIRAGKFKSSWTGIPEIDRDLFQSLRVEAVNARKHSTRYVEPDVEPPDGPQPPNVFVCGGNAIELSPQHFELVKTLWENVGNWVNVEDLEGVFRDEYPSESTVEKAVTRLRRVLMETPYSIELRGSPLSVRLSLPP